MNCREFRKQSLELFEPEIRPGDAAELRGHLQSCPACAREYDELCQVTATLAPSTKIRASEKFKERIMERIVEVESVGSSFSLSRHHGWRLWRLAVAGVVMAALWLLFTMGYNWRAAQTGRPPLSAFSVLAQAAEYMSGIKTLHIKANMRGLPRDNFETIMLNLDFIPVDIWKSYGDPPQWRVEKSGRVIVMDGQATTLLVTGVDPLAVKGGRNTGMIEWLKPLLNVEGLLKHEMELANKEGSKLTFSLKRR